jgi:hypothetical protein
MQYQGDKTSDQERPKSWGVFRWWAGWLKRPQRRAVRALDQRLKSKLVLDPDTGCHLWTGTEKGGYGQIAICARRLAWELANGPIPRGMQVLHRCDEPRCCNPDHLFLGTQAENMADMRRKGSGRNGHSPKPEAPRQRPATRRRTGRNRVLN